MEPRVVRPSLKPVIFQYLLAVFIIAAGIFFFLSVAWFEDKPRWLMALPAVVLFFPIRKHIASRLVKLTIDADRLRLEMGLLSKYVRTIDMTKIQDVTVRQTIGQRMWGLGDLSLETAGETGSLAVHGIDSPRDIAEIILEASKRPSSRGSSTGS